MTNIRYGYGVSLAKSPHKRNPKSVRNSWLYKRSSWAFTSWSLHHPEVKIISLDPCKNPFSHFFALRWWLRIRHNCFISLQSFFILLSQNTRNLAHLGTEIFWENENSPHRSHSHHGHLSHRHHCRRPTNIWDFHHHCWNGSVWTISGVIDNVY